MFNRCRGWRHKLDRLADNELPPGEIAALEDHLTRCPHCRAIWQADRTRQDMLGQHAGMMSEGRIQEFDNQIVASLRVAPTTSGRPAFVFSWQAVYARWSELPFDFIQQMASGALAAATVTVICLFSSLHPKTLETRAVPPPIATRNEPPVPLETLMNTRSPRAALLWSAPAAVNRGARTAPAAHRPKAKNAGRQGAVIEPLTLG